jgi:hypothetical protein
VAVVAVAATVGLAVGAVSRETQPTTTAAAEPAPETIEAPPQPREKATYANQRAVKRSRSRNE